MGELLSLFQRAEGALGAAGQGTSPAELQQLRQRMLEAMGEAETFAKQQRDGEFWGGISAARCPCGGAACPYMLLASLMYAACNTS